MAGAGKRSLGAGSTLKACGTGDAFSGRARTPGDHDLQLAVSASASVAMMSGARACRATMQTVFACWGSGSLRSCSDAWGSWEVLLGFRVGFFSTWENLLFENFCEYAFSRVSGRS